MSHLNMNPNLPNGIPPQMASIMKQDVLPPSSNGLGSSNTSRGSSPGLMQIPASQLPPPRTSIPASQLPPNRNQNSSAINNLAQNYGRMNVSKTNVPQITPTGSPKPAFSTSTPIGSDTQSVKSLQNEVPGNFTSASAFSPISTVSQSAPKPTRTESDKDFKNVPLDYRNDNYVPISNLESAVDPIKGNRNINVEETRLGQGPPFPTSIPERKFQHIENVGMSSSAKQLQDGVQSTSTSQVATGIQNFTFPALSNQSTPAFPVPSKQAQPQGVPPLSTPSGHSSDAASSYSLTNPSQNNQPSTYVAAKSFPYVGQGQQSVLPPASNRFGSLPVASFPASLQNPVSSQNSPAINQTSNAGNEWPSKTNRYETQPHIMRPNVGVFQTPRFPLSGRQPTSVIPPNNMQQSVVVTQSPAVSSATLRQLPVPSSTMHQPPVIPTSNLQQNTAAPSTNFHQNVAPPPNSLYQNVAPPSNSLQQSIAPPPVNLQQQPSAFSASNLRQQSSEIPPTNLQPAAVLAPASMTPLQARTQGPRPTLHSNRYPSNMGQRAHESAYSAPSSAPDQSPYFSSASQPQSLQSAPPNQSINAPQSQFNYQNTSHLYSQQRSSPRQNYPAAQTQGYMGVAQSGFSKLWGHENVDLLQTPNILPPSKVEAPKVSLGQDFLDAANCSPDLFRCTVTKIPETSSLLQKSRLPLGILIHPFKDLEHLPVIQCSTIVRCKACRTYINPFVFFVDAKRWKCNLCYRLNDLPEEFQYDPVSKTYGDPSRRPEIKSSTIEYIAPSEYMLRPPQPAVYLFLFDVSRMAIESGYLNTLCSVLATNLSNLPGDARTQIGFLAYNSALHFYSLADGLNQPHEMTVLDIDDVFLPCPENLIVNLNERKELILDLLVQLPNRFKESCDNSSALGAALQAAHKMISATGGRVTVFQTVLPNKGPGALTPREDPNQRSAAEVQHLNPANDFYKRLALECSGQQIAVDLFIVNSQYVDLATISGISRFSGGCLYHFPLFKTSNFIDNEKFERCLRRYLTRKIGFEAVMRIRCTRGLAIHTFHGNFFVRSTDLLSLPNINPDAGFGMQISIEESLSDLQTVCFQAALLYTSSKGERRIRVHTLCIPVASTLTDIINAADQQCIIGLLSKMAVDRSLQSSLSDAREAFLNVAIDILSSYKLSLNMDSNPSGLLAPSCLKLLPLYISALLKYPAFRTGTSTRLDDRIKAMCDMKSLPLYLLMQQVYPDLYPIHNLEEYAVMKSLIGEEISQPPRLQLSARSLENRGAYIMDRGDSMTLFVCSSISTDFLTSIFGVSDYNAVPEDICELPLWENPHSRRLNTFINYLNDEKPFPTVLQIIKDNSPNRHLFIERLLEDRVENALSYHEFLQHLKTQVK